ncbi:MAG TPA: LptA/OstA family protein [Thermoanaerobaculia bacterium]|jgi:lipopolysaccharide transport protein LptA|nr:LptA/OstA family protein [Thermoanaerobaculia bacterium]
MAKLRSPVAWIRRVLLVFIVFGVIALAGLFWFGRAGQEAAKPKPRTGTALPDKTENLALIGQDFDYTFTEGEKPLFRIRGESVKADRQDTIYLDKVGLTLYDKLGRAFEVESQTASFNRLQNEGRLEGDVRLRGPEGLTLRTPVLLLQDRGKILASVQPVDIGYGVAGGGGGAQYKVRSDLLRIHLEREMYILVGNVELHSVPGVVPAVALRADRVVYERHSRRLRSEGQVQLQRGGDRMTAQIINTFLGPDERSTVFIRAVLNVSGSLAGHSDQPGAARVDFSGKTLGMLTPPREDTAREIELEGTPGAPATLIARGSGLTRKLTSRRLEGRMIDGVMKTARGVAGVDLIETLAPKKGQPAVPPRTAHALGVLANFGPSGQLAEAILRQDVRFSDGKTKARGDRAVLQLDSGQGEFYGAPVEAENERGRMTGPHVVWEKQAGVLRADGGVRALLTRAEEAGLAGSALGSGKGPVWVDAREAYYRTNPQSFLFRGAVRAWRGKDLLLTDELRGDKTEDRLYAKGSVKTLWFPEDDDKDKAAKPQEPIEVVAPEMTYSQTGRKLNYTGGVRVIQTARTLACKDLTVDLKEDKKAEKMICTGDARLADPKTGKTINGERAVYTVDARQIDFSGTPAAPVKMRDKDGNQIQGGQVVYFLDGGKVEIKGKAGVPAPASSTPANPTAAPTPPVTPGKPPTKPTGREGGR